MSNLLVKSTSEIDEVQSLLSKELPSYRKAYSDRTAWLMSFISELAYIKFNPIIDSASKEYFLEMVSKLTKDSELKSLRKLIDMVGYDPDKETQKLKENSEFLNLKLIKTFDKNGTQAILLENEEYIFLGFRGTEPTSFKDIKSDVKATTKMCESGGKIHSGFDEAFAQVALDVQNFINQEEYENKPLFITGHSLGGALATIATKKLKHAGGISACYSFGAPRVGNDIWASNIKTPIYRVVNAMDPVTMLPPGRDTITGLAWALGFLPYLGKTIKKALVEKLGGYYHSGDMRYLTVTQPSDHKNVRLLYSVSIIYRVRGFIGNKLSFGKIPNDHSISIYRSKLKVIAIRRN